MVLLCFVVDLRNISPSLIGDLKQSFLKLSNLHAISSPVDSLTDRIGLCYILKDRISGNDQLKFAYTPTGNFCLRDFHHAINSLPLDAFVPEIDESGAISCRDLKLSSVLCDRALYSWGGRDIMRKVIVLSSCFPEDMDSEAKNTLMAATDKCVSVEFLLFEKQESYLSYTQEKINRFLRCLSDLDNCSFQTCIPDGKSLHGLEKRWLQELKDDTGESLQAQIIFKSNLVGSVNKVFCNITAATNQIVDGFIPCQTCRCHGIPLQDSVEKPTEKLKCSVTNHELGKYDVIENSVKVGNRTTLFLPTIHSLQKLHPVSSQVDFNVIERTNLTSLSEGLLLGIPYIVSPSTCHETEEMDQPDLNTQIFQGLCGALYSMDQGLVCSSNCNLDTMRAVEFHCYYVLQPSEKGPMLLRRLAGSEEVLPICNVSQFAESSIPREIEISVKGALLEIESTNYNPLIHNRGFHQKLNLIVKESLQFGSLHSNTKDATYEVSSVHSDSVIPAEQTFPHIVNPGTLQEVRIIDEEDKATASITKEWELLVVTEEVRMKSPSPVITTIRQVLSPIQSNNKQADMKTSMILERLEAPRKIRGNVGSPNVVIHNPISPDVCVFSQKKPLIPFQTTQVSSSQLMKPSFQRLKRKQK
ncbi:unnamed protein product [Arabidopsis thaliana]|uniref:Uncharacterized protein n=2 Tax=Arabidopsis thaliana TaxID=3702 RepID=Q5Q0B0_ARATH|nr:uncharacterized protein AT5G07380 [Arabidopsis thaliana]NP_001332075.1 uncharacterized protein AT5G07380 [Arabidopsis thaliana]NP_196355.2 uncharacterized protein AT5G07380 [Arabidopsis thaliana]AAV68877.1 hypothetical protein AT5G07380 [Arabidopsis thaliana]AAV68878.1 hypothetical protein AT5G07380 [Arabidopsis thaliana]AAX55192.1 hypothetical protein At5g07380 [Arabidopsis thaliana]AED91148.1 hypothetical protein AT5G07380 [Arabidopsis thaliana]AED91149.1 hypothetical protein AT5G07380 |eukprot:NP_001031848.1 hypothetical protein AT5G07380 [Arabidopsis thaliana]